MRRIALNLKWFSVFCAGFCAGFVASSLIGFVADLSFIAHGPLTGQVCSKSDYPTSVVDQSQPSQMAPTTHSCNCGFNFSSIAPHRLPDGWCLDDEKVPRYLGGGDEQNGTERNVVKHCNHNGCERCLANKTVVFVGDSRVRYQFNHLANFLVSKKRMECQDLIETQHNKGLSLSDESCFVIDHEHHLKMDKMAWNEWHSQSTAMLTKHGEQMALCDCFRNVPFTPNDTFENRFIRRQTPHGTVNLVCLQNFRDLVRIDQEFPPFAPFGFSKHPSARCVPGSCGLVNRTDAFSGNVNETLWTILPLLNATHAFVSLGWPESGKGFKKDKKLSCVIQDFEAHHPHTKVEIITHVPGKFGRQRPGMCDAKKLDCPSVGVFNRWDVAQGVPKFWCWDNLHVLGILNEAFNHKLLERICPIN